MAFLASVQTMTIKKSQIGRHTVDILRALLRQPSKRLSLKHLHLEDVEFETAKDQRDFIVLLNDMEDTTPLIPDLVSLSLVNMDLSNQFMVENLSGFLLGNAALRHLKLANCTLNTKKLNRLLESLMPNGFVRTLDLSRNQLTRHQKEEYKKNKPKETLEKVTALFFQLLQEFIEGSHQLEVLKLQGMALHNDVLALAPTLQAHPRLHEIDLSNNQIAPCTKEYLYRQLNVRTLHTNLGQQLLLTNDHYLHQAWTEFKHSHISDILSSDCANKKIINKLINSKLLRNASRAQPSRLEVIQRDIVHEAKENECLLHIAKEPEYPGFVFNELGIDHVNQFSLSKPMRWQSVDVDQSSR